MFPKKTIFQESLPSFQDGRRIVVVERDMGLQDRIVDIPSSFTALLLKNCEAPYPNHGHVILADPSPILCYRISSTESRCLVDISGKKIPFVGNGEMALYLKTKFFRSPPELQCGFIVAVDEGSIKTMANRSMLAAPQPTPGAILLGDSFNMRHHLT
ncbi:squalene monooxygenase-like protein [Tanacetum coccineum]